MSAVVALLSACTGVVSDLSLDDPDTTSTPDTRSQVSTHTTGSETAHICPESGEPPYATGLRIREIALYQTVKIPLYQDGAWVSNRPAPVIQGKRSLVRVFVEASDDYEPHLVRASLALYNGETITEQVAERALVGSSSDGRALSTFSFEVPGEELRTNTRFTVALEELSCDARPGTADDTRVPATGTQELSATAIGRLRVVLVPVAVNGFEPVTSDETLESVRTALLAYYPVSEVELSLREVLTWPHALAPRDSKGWTDLLDEIKAERGNDSPDPDVYYFGLVRPASTFRDYCSRGSCMLGLAPQTPDAMPAEQIGVGVSFGDAQSDNTIVHEVGHAHGLGHTPCSEGPGSIKGVDPEYPDPNGRTASWGWDSRANKLMEPDRADIMGYCEPSWIGAYNYAAIAERSERVNNKQLHDAGERWRHVLLYGDGSARWGRSAEPRRPSGQTELARVRDRAGRAIAEVEVVRVPLSHASDQFLYIPEPAADWATLELRDRAIELATIQAPLAR